MKPLIVMLLVAGCAARPTLVQVPIAPGILFTLAPLTQADQEIEAAQIVSGNAGETPVQFQTQIKVIDAEVVVTMLDPLGRRSLDIRWNAGGVTSEVAPWVPVEVRPLNVLADIVIAHWPISDVRAGLRGTAARLEQTGKARVISSAGRDVIRVDYEPEFAPPWGGSLVIENFALGYTLKVRSALIGS